MVFNLRYSAILGILTYINTVSWL